MLKNFSLGMNGVLRTLHTPPPSPCVRLSARKWPLQRWLHGGCLGAMIPPLVKKHRVERHYCEPGAGPVKSSESWKTHFTCSRTLPARETWGTSPISTHQHSKQLARCVTEVRGPGFNPSLSQKAKVGSTPPAVTTVFRSGVLFRASLRAGRWD